MHRATLPPPPRKRGGGLGWRCFNEKAFSRESFLAELAPTLPSPARGARGGEETADGRRRRHRRLRSRHARDHPGRAALGADRDGGADRAHRDVAVHPREERLLRRHLRRRGAARRRHHRSGLRRPDRADLEHYPLDDHAARRPLLVQRLLRLATARVPHSPDQVFVGAGLRRRQARRLRADLGALQRHRRLARRAASRPTRPRSSTRASSSRRSASRARACSTTRRSASSCATRASPRSWRATSARCIAAVQLGERRLLELFERFGAETRDRWPLRRAVAATSACPQALASPGPRRRVPIPTKHGRRRPAARAVHAALRLTTERGRIILDTRDERRPGARRRSTSSCTRACRSMIFGIYLLSRHPERAAERRRPAMPSTRCLRAARQHPAAALARPARHRGTRSLRVHVRRPRPARPRHRRPVPRRAQRLHHLLLARPRPAGEPSSAPTAWPWAMARAPFADGLDAIYLVAQENYPGRVHRDRPLRCASVRYAINHDSGGPGRFRGGCGVIREIELLADEAMLAIRIEAPSRPAASTAASRPAAAAASSIPAAPTSASSSRSPTAPSSSAATCCASRPAAAAAGDIRTTAGAEEVQADVLGGFVTLAAARADYGVVLGDDGRTIDAARPPRCGARASRRACSTAAPTWTHDARSHRRAALLPLPHATRGGGWGGGASTRKPSPNLARAFLRKHPHPTLPRALRAGEGK